MGTQARAQCERPESHWRTMSLVHGRQRGEKLGGGNEQVVLGLHGALGESNGGERRCAGEKG
jgi:hypothetical protein